MARTIQTIININGVIIRDQSALHISQKIFEHHTFRFVCPTEGRDEQLNRLLKEPQKLLGAPLHIKVVLTKDSPELLFSGVIMEVEKASNNEHPSNIIIKGYSPTILLDNGRHCQSFERKPIKKIANKILQEYQSAGYSYSVDPSYKETFHYQVQYNETDWQFLKRLASTWGEWLYYNGQKLVLGSADHKKVKLTYKEHLFRFGLQMCLKPGECNMKAYDYVAGEVYNSRLDLQANAEKNDLRANLLDQRQKFYSAAGEVWYNHDVRKIRQVDNFLDKQAAIQQSDMVLFRGSSDMPAFQPGDILQIDTGSKKEEDQPDNEYRIISIEHCWDDAGNYTNEFVAVPAAEKSPPVKPVPEPYCEAQPAVVVENYDKEGFGRITVRFHWMEGTAKTPWLRVVSPYAGKGNGLYIMPEIGDEVMVAFAGGHATQPYVIGAVYNGRAKTAFGNEGNDVKAMQSRSGSQLLMNDDQGSITMQDKQANSILLDGEGTIKFKAKDNIILEVGNTKLEMSKHGIRICAGKVKVEATEELTITSGASANINAKKNMDIKGAKINLN
ncbi:type VI secretion system Vgr family protein [Longitalea luteola]|uniref:type VI secretion system Vgr family protein n=1 Tax=Longitalea luteola TaxID=2812563 RepID=UPI001A97A8EF|nr:type VI secretion system Vgr family protein [Longitalea luteola]